MFCPQCGNETLSERARFCTRCSLSLTSVKDLVETEAAKSKSEGEKKYPLRQQDISLGAGLMIIGLIKAIALQEIGIGAGDRAHELLVLTLMLGLFFSAALMLSQLSPRQRGLTLGATMIFIGSLIGVAAGLAGWGPPTLLTIVGISMVISFFWMQLSSAFTRLFLDQKQTRESQDHVPIRPVLKAADTAQPLPPLAQSYVAVVLNPQEMKTEAPVQPFSVTEDSTLSLKKR